MCPAPGAVESEATASGGVFPSRPMVLKIPALDGELPGQFKAFRAVGRPVAASVILRRSWASVTLPFPGS